jgi:hypothetical protein
MKYHPTLDTFGIALSLLDRNEAEAQSVSFLMDSEYYVERDGGVAPIDEAVSTDERAKQLQLDDPDVWWRVFYAGADWGYRQSADGAENWQRPEGMIE